MFETILLTVSFCGLWVNIHMCFDDATRSCSLFVLSLPRAANKRKMDCCSCSETIARNLDKEIYLNCIYISEPRLSDIGDSQDKPSTRQWTAQRDNSETPVSDKEIYLNQAYGCRDYEFLIKENARQA